MYLSQTSEYAIRAMSTLAAVPAEQPTRSKDLAELAGIPSHYLSKIMRVLVQEGLLTSERGHGGGFRLAKPARKIRFIDVLTAMGQDPETSRCAFGWGECDTARPCALHPAFNQMKRDFVRWATKTTIADVAAAGGLNQAVRRGGV